MKIDIGTSEENRQAIADGLSRLLADTYSLYMKTHGFHWNVTGPQFHSLHTLFMEHYNEMALAVDEIAERIRALGMFAPASYSQFAKLSTVKEETGAPSAEEMLKQLVADHETIVRTAREILPVAQEATDEATVGLVVDRMTLHEKTAWMLRAMLG